MKYPSLVRSELCKTLVEVIIYSEGLTEDGAPRTEESFTAYCNYQSKSKTVLTAQKKRAECSAVLLFNGDICPDLEEISGGQVFINGKCRDIVLGIKARNPDGTVNFTELDVV